MTESHEQMTKLGVGIVGLGQRWRKRYRPALQTLRDQFVVRAVSDARHQRAEREARQLRCRATGVVELLERNDVDAMLLLDAAWHGLWPLEAACRLSKPAFCAVPLDADLEYAEAVCQKVSDARLPVMPAYLLRFAPAGLRLQQLLQEPLGTPRLLLCERRGPKPGRIGVDLLDWCMQLFGAEPVRTRAGVKGAGNLEELFADFGDGRSARIRRWSGPHVRPAVLLRVVAERGIALVDLPYRLRWNDTEGRHALTAIGHQPIAEVLLGQFHRAATAGQGMQPCLEDAQAALKWLCGADHSSTSTEK